MKLGFLLARGRRVTAFLCAGILLASFVLSGCGHKSTVGRDTLVVIIPGDATTLNPIYMQDASSAEIQQFIFDSLAELGPGFRLIPGLATSWHDTPDHLHWIVQLRHGVRWSDGVPFTSADVVWMWKTMLDPATAYPYLGQVTFLKDVQAEGPDTVRFDLKSPNALFVLNVLGWSVIPKHILSKYTPHEQLGTDFSEHPIGTGPYVLDQWQHDDSISLKPNPYWWGGRAKIPHLLYRVVFNNESANQALLNGDAQIIDALPSTAAFELRGKPGIKIIQSPSLYVEAFFPNLRRPGFNENAVLQAMTYGWDRAGVTGGLYHGNDIVATGIETPALIDWYDPHVHQYPYDPEKARALLNNAGWKLGPHGIRTKNGKRLAYTVLSADRTGDGTDRLAEFQADMQTIGIGISIQLIDGTSFNEIANNGKFDLLEEGWGGEADPDQYTFLDSSQVPPIGNNYMHYSDPAVDKDLRLGLTTIDPRKRKIIYDDMQRRTSEHLPIIYAYYPFSRIAISSRVLIPPGTLFPGSIYYNIGDWKLAP